MMTRINFMVVLCKATEFFHRHYHSLSKDGAKIRTFYDMTKYYFAMWLFCRIFAR